MKITEILGLSGFGLALLTFILTRIEKRKKLTFDIYCQNLENVETNKEFDTIDDEIGERRVVVIEIINQGSRSISLDKESIKILINNHIVQHGLDWIGKSIFKNPLNPGQSHKFAVLLESLLHMAKIKDRDYGVHSINAAIKDLDNKNYTSKRKFALLLEVDEIEKQ